MEASQSPKLTARVLESGVASACSTREGPLHLTSAQCGKRSSVKAEISSLAFFIALINEMNQLGSYKIVLYNSDQRWILDGKKFLCHCFHCIYDSEVSHMYAWFSPIQS